MKRLMLFLCCAALLCCLFTGCNQNPVSLSSAQPDGVPTNTVTKDTLALAYNKEDTLDPFSAQTQLNVYLSTLLYDSLVTLDDAFMPQPEMATVKQTDPTHLEATLKGNLKFSDGTAVTAADVVYSYNQAKNSENYKARLSGFSAADASGKTVTFTLRAADSYAAACLNFPIVKQGTATADAAKAPIGSGAYIYNADTATLTANTHAAHSPAFKTVTLRHLVSNASVLQALENGSIQYMFNDLSSGDIPRTTLENKAVDLTQLVYIGVNSKRALTDTAAYRKAISTALDRTAIAAAAYAGRALAATSPFHPKWKPASGLSCINAGSDAEAAASFLKQALAAPTAATTAPTGGTAVNTAKATGTATATTTTAATTATTAAKSAATTAAGNTAATTTAERALTLLYPSGNSCREAAIKMIVSQLAAAGITVNATPLAYDEYISRLKAGNYDLYLGEIRLTPNMDLSAFLQAGGSAAYGVQTGTEVSTAYAAFRDGSGTAAAFVSLFGEQLPYIPLYWRQGMAACAEQISDIAPTAYDLFQGLI